MMNDSEVQKPKLGKWKSVAMLLRGLILLFSVAMFCLSTGWAADSSASPAAASAPAVDQKAVAAALEKIYAEATLDAQQNITAVNFTDSDFTDEQLALLRGLPKLETVVVVGSAF